jgi:hypothetical protein
MILLMILWKMNVLLKVNSILTSVIRRVLTFEGLLVLEILWSWWCRTKETWNTSRLFSSCLRMCKKIPCCNSITADIFSTDLKAIAEVLTKYQSFAFEIVQGEFGDFVLTQIFD